MQRKVGNFNMLTSLYFDKKKEYNVSSCKNINQENEA